MHNPRGSSDRARHRARCTHPRMSQLCSYSCDVCRARLTWLGDVRSQSLMALDGAGYTDIVGVRMGYNGWINKFTNKLQRRRSDGYLAPQP
jgi:hypothetical protein